MKLNLSTVLLDHDDKPIKRADADGTDRGSELHLQHALFAAVNSTFRGEEQLAPEVIYKRGKLARKVKDTTEKNFSSEEVQIMLTCVAKRYSADPLFVLKVSEILDPEKFKPEA